MNRVVRVTLDGARTKLSGFGRLFAESGYLTERFESAAARAGAPQLQSNGLWGIYYEVAPIRGGLVDVELAKVYAERVLWTDIEITITEQQLEVAA